jgi:hypothetical protein
MCPIANQSSFLSITNASKHESLCLSTLSNLTSMIELIVLNLNDLELIGFECIYLLIVDVWVVYTHSINLLKQVEAILAFSLIFVLYLFIRMENVRLYMDMRLMNF